MRASGASADGSPPLREVIASFVRDTHRALLLLALVTAVLVGVALATLLVHASSAATNSTSERALAASLLPWNAGHLGVLAYLALVFVSPRIFAPASVLPPAVLLLVLDSYALYAHATGIATALLTSTVFAIAYLVYALVFWLLSLALLAVAVEAFFARHTVRKRRHWQRLLTLLALAQVVALVFTLVLVTLGALWPSTRLASALFLLNTGHVVLVVLLLLPGVTTRCAGLAPLTALVAVVVLVADVLALALQTIRLHTSAGMAFGPLLHVLFTVLYCFLAAATFVAVLESMFAPRPATAPQSPLVAATTSVSSSAGGVVQRRQPIGARE